MNLRLIANEYEIAAQLDREENPDEVMLPEDIQPEEGDAVLPDDIQ